MRFYLVGRITEFDKGSRIRGYKNVSIAEPYFTYHFPRYPVMPGVLIVESMAQLAGLLLELSIPDGTYRKAILSIIDKTKFRQLVRPGDRLDMEAVIENNSGTAASCLVSARVDGEILSETRLTFALQDVTDDYDGFQEGERNALVKTLMRGLPKEPC